MKDKNPSPTVMVRFKGEGQTRVFQPGAKIEGIVEINPSSTIKCRAVEIRVGWHTEGRGTRADQYPYFNKVDTVNEILPEQPFVEPFSLTIPSEPWSYSGQLVSVVWAVEVKIDIPMGSDVNYMERFVVQP